MTIEIIDVSEIKYLIQEMKFSYKKYGANRYWLVEIYSFIFLT